MPPSTTPPPPPPTHGSGKFIAAVIIMLLMMGGLIYWKVGGSSDKPGAAPTAPVAAGPAEPTVDQIVPAPPPPPPPPVTEDAGVPTTAKKPAGPGIGTNCSSCGKCTGDAAPSFSAVLRARAGQAQRCYEKALTQQEGLQGKLSVSLCVGVGGAVCGASVSKDTLGSPLVSQCVLNIYRATTFPSPKNGCVDAEVPLNFLPEKK
jgi:hypothetical protein